MYKINIKKDNIITHSAQFTTEQQCYDFLNSNASTGAFGKMLREVRQITNIIDDVPVTSLVTGEDMSLSMSSRVETILGEDVTFHTLPADYTHEILDITLQVVAEKESQEAQQLLNTTDYKVLRHIRQQALTLPTTLTQAEYLALEQQRHDASLKVI